MEIDVFGADSKHLLPYLSSLSNSESHMLDTVLALVGTERILRQRHLIAPSIYTGTPLLGVADEKDSRVFEHTSSCK